MGSNACLHAGFDVSLEHLIEVHSIDVIRTNHDNVVRTLIAEAFMDWRMASALPVYQRLPSLC